MAAVRAAATANGDYSHGGRSSPRRAKAIQAAALATEEEADSEMSEEEESENEEEEEEEEEEEYNEDEEEDEVSIIIIDHLPIIHSCKLGMLSLVRRVRPTARNLYPRQAHLTPTHINAITDHH